MEILLGILRWQPREAKPFTRLQISQYLGHESLDTTVIYTHLTAISEARTQVALATLYKPLKP